MLSSLPLPWPRRAAGTRAPSAAAVPRPLSCACPVPGGVGRRSRRCSPRRAVQDRRGGGAGHRRPEVGSVQFFSRTHPALPTCSSSFSSLRDTAPFFFFSVSLYLFLSLPAGPDFRSASSFGGTRLACFGIKMSRSWRLCPSTSGYGQAATVSTEQINISHVIEILARDSRRLHFIASHQAAVISSSDYCRRARESWLIRPFLPPTRDPEPSTRTTMEQNRVCWASVR